MSSFSVSFLTDFFFFLQSCLGMKPPNIHCSVWVMIWIWTSNFKLQTLLCLSSGNWKCLFFLDSFWLNPSICTRREQKKATVKWKSSIYVSPRKGIYSTRAWIQESCSWGRRMKKENRTGINAAERYFYWLWKSKSLQSNDCGKRHDILISFNMKRNDGKGKHSRKPNKMYCLTVENNAIKKMGGKEPSSIHNSI